jgi:hypothetical protein
MDHWFNPGIVRNKSDGYWLPIPCLEWFASVYAGMTWAYSNFVEINRIADKHLIRRGKKAID